MSLFPVFCNSPENIDTSRLKDFILSIFDMMDQADYKLLETFQILHMLHLRYFTVILQFSNIETESHN